MKHINKWTRAELLALPDREWGRPTPTYDSILVLPTKRKHDSGWGMMTIIGVTNTQPIEIVTTGADDIEWLTPDCQRLPSSTYLFAGMRTDCAWRSGAINFWLHNHVFEVSHPVSSVTITLKPKTK